MASFFWRERMFEGYRFISARSLLGLSRLDRCQDLPQGVWSPVGQFWHLVFILALPDLPWSALDVAA
jgi:hypothetical protein